MELQPTLKPITIIDQLSQALSLAFKLSTFLGGLYFAFYCHRLNYFPVGVTVGDSLLFIILATSFGLIYTLIIFCLLSFGMCWTYPILNPIYRYIHKKRKKDAPNPVYFLKPELIHWILALIGALFIYTIYQVETDELILLNLLGTTFVLSTIWATYNDPRLNINIILSPFDKSSTIDRQNKSKQTKCFLLILVPVIPIIFSGISVRLLDAGMKLSKVNLGASYVLVKPPYDKVIPEDYKDKKSIYTEAGFTSFTNINVMLMGIGQKTVIEFAQNPKNPKQKQILAIPNDKITVIPIRTEEN